jgi:polar amino acid transport system substrate-binding protein
MRKLWKKTGAAILGLTLAILTLTGCGGSQNAASNQPSQTEGNVVYRTVDEIKKSGTINIGVFSDKSPFGYVDENGEYQGYDVYFANRIGKDLGVKINYISTEAANRIEYLQTGKVDIILANFTVTEERAQQVDFTLPYMNVALGVVSPDSAVITSLDEIGPGDEVIVISGTTAETYLEKNYPNIKLQKYDTYAEAKTAFENGNGVAWANDNTEVIAFAIENSGYTVGIPSLGSADTIAAAVTKGNKSLLDWLNNEIISLGKERFFHAAYEATLLDTYGKDYEDTLVIEGGGAAAVSAVPAAAKNHSANAVKIGVPDDSTNQARAIKLLEAAGLITVDPAAGYTPELADITGYIYDVELVPTTANTLPSTLDDFGASTINGTYAIPAGLLPSRDALIIEKQDESGENPYVNVIVARTADAENEIYHKIVDAYHTQIVAEYILSKYKEASFPVFKYDANFTDGDAVVADVDSYKSDPSGKTVVKIGVCGASNEQWKAVQKVLDEQNANIFIELVTFDAYTLPNEALNSGDIDLNAFQHKAYLKNDSTANGYDLKAIGDTIIAPLSLYSKKVTSLQELKDLAGPAK